MRITLLVPFLLSLFALLALGACGGGEPEAEATWETHTTAESGGEDVSESAEGAPEEEGEGE